ncbi:MAG TPA: TIR and AAA domain-containing protein [Verrucomicrobiales bacterium]|nr:TIR and AAA domain-containing protein [Verrucomicrobiales bacterium]
MPTSASPGSSIPLPDGRVFVSYTHDSPAHMARVRKMVQTLRDHGFTISFDQDQPAGGPDHGWATWSENEAATAPRVLIVATEAFAKCWLGQHPPGMRDGATWEAACLANRTYSAGARVGFIRPIIFERNDAAFIPLRLRGLTRYDGETGLEGLIAWLLGELEVAPVTSAAADAIKPAPVPVGPAFDISHPATGNSFVGRSEEMAEFDNCLASGRGCSLVGDARIGKSSLLLAWRDRARRAGNEAHVVDFQAITVNYPAFLQAATGGTLKFPSSPTLTADDAAHALNSWAGNLTKPPVILLDETEAGVRNLDHRFFERLRAMMPGVIFMISSRKPLPEVFEANGHTSPFANLTTTWRLGLLDDAAAASLAARAGEHAGLLRYWAGNHPYYLQALGLALQRTSPHDSFEQALQRFYNTASDRLKETWSTLSNNSRAALERAASGLAVDNGNLKTRALLTSEGRPFGQVLARWLHEKE